MWNILMSSLWHSKLEIFQSNNMSYKGLGVAVPSLPHHENFPIHFWCLMMHATVCNPWQRPVTPTVLLILFPWRAENLTVTTFLNKTSIYYFFTVRTLDGCPLQPGQSWCLPCKVERFEERELECSP